MDCEWCDGEEGRVWTVSGVMGRRGGWTGMCKGCVVCPLVPV